MSGAYEVREEGRRTHFHLMPNIVDDLGLSPLAYRLYGHYKRVTGESGRCTESAGTVAKTLAVSKPTVLKGRKELEDAKLIKIAPNRNRTLPDSVVVLDIWERNAEHFVAVKDFDREQNGSPPVVNGFDREGPLAVKNLYTKKSKEESSSKSADVTQLPDDTTAKCLLLLSRVKGFPKSNADNALYLAELRTEFPSVDAARVCREYQIWHKDNPGKTRNFRSRLRNFFQKASQDAGTGSATGRKWKVLNPVEDAK